MLERPIATLCLDGSDVWVKTEPVDDEQAVSVVPARERTSVKGKRSARFPSPIVLSSGQLPVAHLKI